MNPDNCPVEKAFWPLFLFLFLFCFVFKDMGQLLYTQEILEIAWIQTFEIYIYEPKTKR